MTRSILNLAALTRRRGPRRRPSLHAFLVEHLETRALLSTIQVTSTSDRPFAADGGLTLRDAILLVDGGLTVGQLSPAQQALVTGTPDQPGVTDTIDFNLPFNDPGHVYYKYDGSSGSVSTADIVPVPTVAIDGFTPITSDAQLADPSLVGAGNTIDPDWTHSWWSINTTFTLPSITSPVTIDGYSQTGSRRNSLIVGDNAILTIELNGTGTVPADFPFYGYATGLVIAADNTTVQGLVVNRFDHEGIGVPPNGVGGPTGVAIQGCFVGTDPSGTVAQPDGYAGIDSASAPSRIGTDGNGIDDTGGGPNYSDYAERNIISGNAVFGVRAGTRGAVVAGNYIGTDRTGTISLPNSIGVEFGGARVGVDGHDADPVAERNVISGNISNGVNAYSGSVVAGNYIGTDATGLQPLGNTGAGVVAYGGALIGTDGDGVGDGYERNVISGNNPGGGEYGTGIVVFDSANQIAGNYIGTDPTGTFSIGDQTMGVILWGGSSDNVIGYDSQHPDACPADQRNVISGDLGWGVWILGGAYQNVVAGNFFGTDSTGTAPVPNGTGIEISGGSYNVIGTDSDGVGDDLERNIISGNANSGVAIVGGGNDYNVVAGNYIGLDVTGTRALGNGYYGGVIFGSGASGIGNLIGVDATSANPTAGRNVISASAGITIQGGSSPVADDHRRQLHRHRQNGKDHEGPQWSATGRQREHLGASGHGH